MKNELNYSVLTGISGYKIRFLKNFISAGYTSDGYLLDLKDKKYVDLKSGMWNINLLPENIKVQIAELINTSIEKNDYFVDIQSDNKSEFDYVSNELKKLAGSFFLNGKVIFTNSGTESNNVALRMANALKYGKILTFNISYHGATGIAHDVSGLDSTSDNDNVNFIKFPLSDVECEESLKYVARFLKNNVVSTFIFEPVPASAGVFVPKFSYLNNLIRLLKENNVTVIFDEVATGFFRTGKLFFYNYLEETPDIITFSKAITNGVFPFGGVITSENFWIKFINSKNNVEYFQTQNGNLLGFRVAKLVLNYYATNLPILEKKTSHLHDIVLDCGFSETRSIGGMVGIQTSSSWKSTLDIVYSLQQDGIIVYPFGSEYGSGITIMPILEMDPVKFRNTLKFIKKRVMRFE